MLEREPYWAPELRRQFIAEEVSVRHCTSATGVQARCDLLVADVSGLPSDCIAIFRHPRTFFSILIGSEGDRELESPLREAGASSFISEPLSGEELARRIRKVWSLRSET